MKNQLLTLFIFLQIFVAHLSTQTLPSYGRWVVTDSLKHIKGDIATVILPNGNVLGAGLWGACEIYDITTGTWGPADSLSPSGFPVSYLILLDSNRVLALRDGYEPCEIYDISNNQWSIISLPIDNLFGYEAVRMNDGRVMIAGGYNEQSNTVTFTEIYDPDTNVWVRTAPMNNKRASFTMTTLHDGNILITGGVKPGGAMNKTEYYDEGMNQWFELDTMMYRRAYHNACLLKDGRIVISGTDLNVDQNKAIEIYDPETKEWSVLGETLDYWFSHHVFQISDSLLLIHGGSLEQYRSEIFDIYLGQSVYTDSTLKVYSSFGSSYKNGGSVIGLRNKSYLDAGGKFRIDMAIIPTEQCFLFIPDNVVINNLEEAAPNREVIEIEALPPYPNPTNGLFTIQFKLNQNSDFLIGLFDILGREIKNPVTLRYNEGYYNMTFETNNMTSGIYFLVLESRGRKLTQKINIIK